MKRWPKFFHPEPILHLTAGLVLAAVAAIANGLLGFYLFRLGSRTKSLIVRAGLHLMPDCRTSAAVVISLILTVWFHSNLIDPIAGYWRRQYCDQRLDAASFRLVRLNGRGRSAH